jgi:transketolase C-terminal domain/subunit
MPWLNKVDIRWLPRILENVRCVWVIEDHSPIGGLADTLTREMAQHGVLKPYTIRRLGVQGTPAWGSPDEVLKHHGMDRESIAATVEKEMHGT